MDAGAAAGGMKLKASNGTGVIADAGAIIEAERRIG